MRKLNLILGIICVVLALVLFMAGSAVGGVVLLLIGGLNIIIGLRKKEALNPKIEAQITQEPSRNMVKALSVAGVDYYQDGIRQIMGDPDDVTNNEIKDMYLDGALDENEKYYLYAPYITRPVLEHEPDNEFDPNAIAVLIDDIKIGYVPKKYIELVNEYLDNKTFEAEIYGGDYKTVSFKDDYTEDPQRSDLTVTSFKDTFGASLRIFDK